jgi:hypothetical protein
MKFNQSNNISQHATKDTRINLSISSFTLDDYNALLKAAQNPSLSSSTILKDKWVERIYSSMLANLTLPTQSFSCLGFNDKINELENKDLASFPLNTNRVSAFVVYCAQQYAEGSISDVIVPALKRLEKANRNLHKLDGLCACFH